MRVYADRVMTTESPLMKAICHGLIKREQERHTEKYRQFYKKVCNKIRKDLQITSVVGIRASKDGSKIDLFIYNVEADPDEVYPQTYDETVQQMYIEV